MMHKDRIKAISKVGILKYKSILLITLIIALFCVCPAVIKAATGEAITGIGTAETVLQLGETESRTASTVEPGIITWVSENPAVATVDAGTGVVSAIAEGTTNISYTSDSGNNNTTAVTVYAAATVIDPALPPESVVQVGEDAVTLCGEIDAAAGETQTWFSSDVTKSTVTEKTVTPVAAGATTISYRNINNTTNQVAKKGSIDITVEAAALVFDLMLPDGQAAQLGEGDVVFEMPALGENMSRIISVGSNIDFRVKDPLITVLLEEEKEHYVSYKTRNKLTFRIENKGEITFAVYPAAQVINPVLPVGTAVQVGAGAVVLADYAVAGIGQTQTWSADDETKAVVADGVVTPLAAGAVTISYYNKDEITNALITKGALEINVLPAAASDGDDGPPPAEPNDDDPAPALPGGGAPPLTPGGGMPPVIPVNDSGKTADDRLLENTIKETGKAEIELGYSGHDTVEFSVEYLLELAALNKKITIKYREMTLRFAPQDLLTEADIAASSRYKMALRFKFGVNRSLDKVNSFQIKPLCDVFEVVVSTVTYTDATILVKKVEEFSSPLEVTIDLSALYLSSHDLECLCGTRLEKDKPIGEGVVPLGGTYDAAKKNLTFYTERFSFLTIVKREGLVRLSLTVGSQKVSVNGAIGAIDVAPIIIKDRVMVPLRFIGEALKATVGWDSITRRVFIKLSSQELRFVVDQTEPGLDVPPILINGRTMVPLRYITEKFGAYVMWFPASMKVTVVK